MWDNELQKKMNTSLNDLKQVKIAAVDKWALTIGNRMIAVLEVRKTKEKLLRGDAASGLSETAAYIPGPVELPSEVKCLSHHSKSL